MIRYFSTLKIIFCLLLSLFFSVIVDAKLVDGVKREYDQGVSVGQKKDIGFIVKTLANSSLTSIWKNKPALERAGEHIESIHPLQFFLYIFSDEELKVGLRNIKQRGGWVGKEFFSGIFESLTRESKLENMTYEHVCDLSSSLGISPDLIYTCLKEERWNDFVETMITLLPRKGDPDRYNF